MIKKSYKDDFSAFIRKLQSDICAGMESLEPKEKFIIDEWQRDGGGGGLTRVLEHGDTFERAGVNTSVVYGKMSPALKKQLESDAEEFFACGLSLVIHPKNPFVPTVHANIRYFEMSQDDKIVKNWFGGGIDLTPYYINEEDIKHFHQTLKSVCDSFHADFYKKYKQECDEYFYNAHRHEARGVGGIFFDYLEPNETTDICAFTKAVGNSFLDAYAPIVRRRINDDYNSSQKEWQELRRGRYVEFNLIHDRGTTFGLKSNGRIESILMSLPTQVQWKYNYTPAEDTPEFELIKILKEPKNWV